jgi:hypothetical protein
VLRIPKRGSAPTIKRRNAGGGEVTDGESARARLIKTRNGRRIDFSLLPAAKEEYVAALEKERAGGGPDKVPEEREAFERAYRAPREGGLCGGCGRALKEEEPVYTGVEVYRGMMGGVFGIPIRPAFEATSVCESCAPERMRSYTLLDYGQSYRRRQPVARPCGVCSRLVVFRITNRSARRRRTFCSERCQWTHYNRVRGARGARARQKVCEVCGEEFVATRRDAKTCSKACKQKAYRQRVMRRS